MARQSKTERSGSKAPRLEHPRTGRADISHRAIRGTVLLALRQGATSLITFAGVISLSTLLSPGNFALYGYATTLMLIAASVGDLGLGANLIRTQPTARHLSGSFALQLVFWVPVCLILAIAGGAFGAYGFTIETTTLLAAALLLLSLQALPSALLERSMAFGTLAALETTQRIVFVLGAVTLAAIAPSQSSIPIAAVAAATVGYPLALAASRWQWMPRFASGDPLFRGFSSDWWQSRIANQLAFAAYPFLGGLLFTSEQVGYIVWALAITSVPALLAPTVARAVYPAMAHSDEVHKTIVFSRLFRGVLLLGLPLVAILLSCAEPLVDNLFGSKWNSAIPLLRLEAITTLIGLAMTTAIPLLFLTLHSRMVKWMMIAATAATWLLAPLLVPLVSFKAISVATIAVNAVVLVLVDRALWRTTAYSLIRDMGPGLAGLVSAVAAGVPLSLLCHTAATTILIATLVGAMQLAVTLRLGGGVDLSVVLLAVKGGRRV